MAQPLEQAQPQPQKAFGLVGSIPSRCVCSRLAAPAPKSAVIRRLSLDLPTGLRRRPRDGRVVSSLRCMNDPQSEGHMASYLGRRKFLATLGGSAAWPHAVGAQQGKRLRHIGMPLASMMRHFNPGGFLPDRRELNLTDDFSKTTMRGDP